MQTLELRDHALQWETERQNRILQSAVEQRKKQARMDGTRQDMLRAEALPKNVPNALAEWVDKIHAIPDMRSALIPMDEGADVEEWSKPFSLAKADMEPWLSFYNGYKQSRLFIETALPLDAAEEGLLWPTLDYAVRAFLQLRQLSPRLVTEPPVQINRQVVYFDLERELKVNGEPTRVKALLKSAASVHDAELRKAVEKGREMGNLLHDALMGEGHGNLIKAWGRVYQRKPNVEELHQMLTTGRVNVCEPKLQAAAPKPPRTEVRDTAITKANIEGKRAEAVAPIAPPPRIDPAILNKLVTDTEPEGDAAAGKVAGNKRKVIWYLAQAVVCCAALAGVVFAF